MMASFNKKGRRTKRVLIAFFPFTFFFVFSYSFDVMLPSFITIAAGIFLSVNMATAQDSGGLSSQQSCLLNCSLAAVTASGCDM
jgi:hypothetical protein